MKKERMMAMSPQEKIKKRLLKWEYKRKDLEECIERNEGGFVEDLEKELEEANEMISKIEYEYDLLLERIEE